MHSCKTLLKFCHSSLRLNHISPGKKKRGSCISYNTWNNLRKENGREGEAYASSAVMFFKIMVGKIKQNNPEKKNISNALTIKFCSNFQWYNVMQKVYLSYTICARQTRPFQSPQIVMYRNYVPVKPDSKHFSVTVLQLEFQPILLFSLVQGISYTFSLHLLYISSLEHLLN